MTQRIPLYQAIEALRRYNQSKPFGTATWTPRRARNWRDVLQAIRLAIDEELVELHAAASEGYSRCGIPEPASTSGEKNHGA